MAGLLKKEKKSIPTLNLHQATCKSIESNMLTQKLEIDSQSEIQNAKRFYFIVNPSIIVINNEQFEKYLAHLESELESVRCFDESGNKDSLLSNDGTTLFDAGEILGKSTECTDDIYALFEFYLLGNRKFLETEYKYKYQEHKK